MNLPFQTFLHCFWFVTSRDLFHTLMIFYPKWFSSFLPRIPFPQKTKPPRRHLSPPTLLRLPCLTILINPEMLQGWSESSPDFGAHGAQCTRCVKTGYLISSSQQDDCANSCNQDDLNKRLMDNVFGDK